MKLFIAHLKFTLPRLVRATLLCIGLAYALDASAQGSYPTETIRIITPYAPGSMVDSSTRMVAEGLSKKLQQAVVVENRTGAMGMIAMNAMLAAPADGYTLMTDTPASAINPTLNKARYDPKVDIAPIAQFMRMPFVLAVNPALKVATARDLVNLLKTQPNNVNVAVAGTSTGLVGDLFAQQSGVGFQAIPYKGAAPAMLAVLSNEAQVIFLDVANLAPHIKSGKLKGLLVTGDQRSDAIKDVPTAKEAGFGQFRPTTWFGLFSRTGVPIDIQRQLNETVQEVMNTQTTREFLQLRGATAAHLSLGEFKDFFHSEISTWADVIRSAQPK
jgi:tripartite-type tricarboxylate transporter receptor subunit TctC